MTDEQISEIIAAQLFPPDPTRCERCGWPIHKRLEDGCTKAVCRIVDPPPKIKPDFIRNPFLRDLLQAKLLNEGWKLELHSTSFPSNARIIGMSMYCGEREFEFAALRKRCWALAYLKAHGLEGK